MIHNHEVGGSCPPLATLIMKHLQILFVGALFFVKQKERNKK